MKALIWTRERHFERYFSALNHVSKLTIFCWQIFYVDWFPIFYQGILPRSTISVVSNKYWAESRVLRWQIWLQCGYNLWRECQSSYHKCWGFCTNQHSSIKYGYTCMCRRHPIFKPYALQKGSMENTSRQVRPSNIRETTNLDVNKLCCASGCICPWLERISYCHWGVTIFH